jgi:hypothetical protein
VDYYINNSNKEIVGEEQTLEPRNRGNEQQEAQCLSIEYRYSLLFRHADSLQLNDLLNLKFSRKVATKILSILKIINTQHQEINEFFLKELWVNNDDYLQCIIILVSLEHLSIITAEEFLTRFYLRPKPIFPLTGYDLQQKNLHGKTIGKLMSKLKISWIESDFMMDKTQLLQLLEDYYE